MKVLKWFGFFLIMLILSACGSTNISNDDLVIYTSVYPIQYLTEEIAGDSATVKSVYPPGVDAHTYEPTSREITELANADAFFYLGAGMESFAESAADSIQSQDVLLIEIGQEKNLFINGQTSEEYESEANNGEQLHDLDPHIWLDPLRMIKVGEIILDRLIELNPEDEQQYKNNFNKLKENLTELDEEFTETLNMKENKQIIVSHAAYGYWEERYGVEQIPISGLSSSDEPSQKDLAVIAKVAKEHDFKYVIFEQTGSNRLASIIQEYISAEKLTIHSLEVLTEGDISNNEDYLSLMKKNLTVLDQATN